MVQTRFFHTQVFISLDSHIVLNMLVQNRFFHTQVVLSLVFNPGEVGGGPKEFGVTKGCFFCSFEGGAKRVLFLKT